MVSKSQIKLVRQLGQKKYRDQHQLFVAEGLKVIREFVEENYQLHQLYALEERHFPSQHVSLVNQAQMKAMSDLKTPSDALAVFAMPRTQTSFSVRCSPCFGEHSRSWKFGHNHSPL